MEISIIGSGSWATAIANLLSESQDVLMYARDINVVNSINENHINVKYFPDEKLRKNIRATSNIEELFENKYIVNAIPTQSIRSVYENLVPYFDDNKVIINLSKGLELNTHFRISEILEDILGDINYAIVSGPSHAEEVIKEMPTTLVCASNDINLAMDIQDIFNRDYFRVYTSTDVIGVEIGGSIKNILAFGIGMADGLSYGDNSKTALITRGIHEMERFARSFGADEKTINGLAGIGDLIVTATSNLSRNNRAGRLIGEGYSIEESIAKVNMVVEGIPTTRAVYELSKEKNIEMPITYEIYKVLFEGKSAHQSVKDLMARDLKNEY
ncbi:NAD(P)H-dependent glycerol-3-phosphate dehydrogenase [Anaerococcus sp.]|uniref:NAD(P)H-dependent glycerol-3-phosphate dehydrogenase n=1 Tax=Anaerococcus sp. TaxID=1872515 RepID=UPI0027BA7B80|nr:NAD(P)H-dependent glycerol-3-phosphate dehydrogenase [Anaerococcus sp.]